MRIALMAAALLLAAAGTALAQPIAEVESEGPVPGWVLTPRVAVGHRRLPKSERPKSGGTASPGSPPEP